MIYGAYGYSGALIAKEAVARGHRPLLVGRNQKKLRDLSTELNLEMRVLDLEDDQRLAAMVTDYDLVMNAAGPHARTSRPVIRACLGGRAHYLDICGEYYVLEDTFAFDSLARKSGIAIVPGVGFDVISTDCLVRYLSERMPSAIELEIAIAVPGRPSKGTVGTSMEIFSRGSLVRRNGVLEPFKFGRGAKEIRFSHGKLWAVVPVPWADLATGYRTTNIPNITVYFAINPRLLKLVGPGAGFVQLLLSSEIVRKISKALIGPFIKGPGSDGRADERSYLWAQVKDDGGSQIEAWLETGEVYQFTAAAAVRAVEETLSGNLTGVLTPAQAFGADFVLGIEGVKRFDSPPVREDQ